MLHHGRHDVKDLDERGKDDHQNRRGDRNPEGEHLGRTEEAAGEDEARAHHLDVERGFFGLGVRNVGEVARLYKGAVARELREALAHLLEVARGHDGEEVAEHRSGHEVHEELIGGLIQNFRISSCERKDAFAHAARKDRNHDEEERVIEIFAAEHAGNAAENRRNNRADHERNEHAQEPLHEHGAHHAENGANNEARDVEVEKIRTLGEGRDRLDGITVQEAVVNHC